MTAMPAMPVAWAPLEADPLEVPQQVLELLLSKIASEGRHHVTSAQDHLRHAVIARRSAARQIRLAKNTIETRAMQRLRVISIVTARACGDEDGPAARLIWRK